MVRTPWRTPLRTALVLLAAVPVMAAAWATTPPYNPEHDAALTAKAEALQADEARKTLPAPKSEAALRRVIGEIQQGHPNYAGMTRGLADAVRQQLPRSRRILAERGPLRSVVYLGRERARSLLPGPGKLADPPIDRYRVTFQNGSLWWVISETGGVMKLLVFDAPEVPKPQDWIDSYASFPARERVERLVTQLGVLLLAALFARLALRIRL